MSFIEDTQTVEFQKYDDGSQGDGLLRIQWRNGEARSKTGGYFFVSKERLGDTTPGAPWVETEETFESGATAEGFKAEALRLAIIGVRQQPYLRTDAGKVWLEKYAKGEQGASIQVDVLAVVEGLEDLGVVVWGSATVKTGFAIVGRPDGIVHRLYQEIVKPASALAKKDMRPWCFWATVATEKDAKGKPIYTQTKGKPVTLPVLVLPAAVDKDYLNSVYTGRDMVLYGEQQRAAYDAWMKERRTNDAPRSKEQQPDALGWDKHQPKNKPVEIEDADLPF